MEPKPILGVVAKSDDVHRFREVKLDLKEKGYPIEETKQFVKEFFEKIKEVVSKRVDNKTLLIKVPSGSGLNKVTVIFANEISKSTGAGILPDNLIRKQHTTEAKKSLTLEKRNLDPIGYEIDARTIKDIAKNFDKVLIVDDLIGSGESSIRLAKTLEGSGIKVFGLINLVTIENRYPTPGDFNRVHNKINQFARLVMSDSVVLSSNLKTVFSEYTRQKLNRFERDIRNEVTAVNAFKNVSKAATIEKKLSVNIDKSLGI